MGELRMTSGQRRVHHVVLVSGVGVHAECGYEEVDCAVRGGVCQRAVSWLFAMKVDADE